MALEEEGEFAPLLFEWWYKPSADVSDPETGGERGSYKSGDGGGEPEMGKT